MVLFQNSVSSVRKFPSTDVLRLSLHLRFKGNLFLIVWLLDGIL